MIFTYNRAHVGDVLMVIIRETNQKLDSERRGSVARIFTVDDNQTVAWNIFDVSTKIAIEGSGQVSLSDEAVATLNQDLEKEGFSERLINDSTPKFVVGEIVEMTPHADSDHLNICQVAISAQESVQIVAGAPNAAVGLKTIVALPGAMMPSGSLIFPGKLRGEDSFGMMCSPRELALPNAPQKRGIIELDDMAVVGEAFDMAKHWQLA
ncbi:YtpR family tRNA-binding protein [Streptococcus sp. zg-JUN1979]|uniref:YtpR family tRNA-binding protein n=1 Tax=Streptococcus sp. zg-JUN1979 TaxID=3391450 RepID=UPI0039A4B611